MARLSPAQIARVAKDAGFSGRALQIAVAVALGESGGNTHAHNPVPPDDSYGLWQINMIGSLGPARRRQFGLSSNSELFNPAVNARAAYAISSRGSDFTPWTVFRNRTYLMHMSRAAEGVRNVGEAVVPEGGGGGGAGPISIGGGVQEISFTPSSEADPALSFDIGGMWESLLDGITGGVLSIPDAIGGLVAGIGTISDLFMVWTTALVKGTVWISDPGNWVRVGQVILGGALVLSGAAIVARPYTAPVARVARAAIPGR